MRTRNKARKRVDKNKARREKIMNIWKKKNKTSIRRNSNYFRRIMQQMAQCGEEDKYKEGRRGERGRQDKEEEDVEEEEDKEEKDEEEVENEREDKY